MMIFFIRMFRDIEEKYDLIKPFHTHTSPKLLGKTPSISDKKESQTNKY